MFGHLHKRALNFAESPVTPSRLGALLDLLESGSITGSVAKRVLALMMDGDVRDSKAIVEANEWQLVVDEARIEQWCAQVLTSERQGGKHNVSAYKAGKLTVLKYFVGQVIGLSQGRAHPDVVPRVLTRLLEKET